jgi:ferrous iron transport protein B
MDLSELQNGQEGVIVKVKGHGEFRMRLMEMGFVRGKFVKAIKNAPLKDPIEYQILDYNISLRRSEARYIEIITKEEASKQDLDNYHGVITNDILKQSANRKGKTIHVAFVGNPNCGKTSIFNWASGAFEHVGNYSGVTVDVKKGSFEQNGYTFHIYDLPGTYSLSAYSPEELYVREHIVNETPDIVLNVLDASNLERNLYLTTQLIDMDIKVVAALNMFDDLKRHGDYIDYEQLGTMLGIPFVPTVGSKGHGIKRLFDTIIEVYEDKNPKLRHIHINYGEEIEKSIENIEMSLKGLNELEVKMSPRYIAIKALEKDKKLLEVLESNEIYRDLLNEIKIEIARIEDKCNEKSEVLIADAKYGFIAGAVKETFKESPKNRRRKTEMVDAIITHRLFGIPIFLFFMWVMFQATFTLGSYPMNWIEKGVAALSSLLNTSMPDGMLKDLLVDGIIGGVGGVIVFLPNILILFFFISFMEDTGYMARAAFIMDKLMHKIGLHGKSFIPLIMGFGCNVPAIMATRTIEDRNNRILTILINPFMSCSARLPVYILIIGAFFPEYAGTVLFSMYAGGILIAIVSAKVFKKYLFKGKDTPFVMELPTYRIPTLRSTLRHMWHKGEQYLKKMGGIIMIASIIIWFLGYFPRDMENSSVFENKIEQINNKYEVLMQDAPEVQKNDLKKEKEEQINWINVEKEKLRQQNSYIGKIGQWIEPVMRPLGFDWKMGVSLLSGIAAKEIVVSTISVLYQAKDEQAGQSELIKNMRSDTYADGTPVFTPLIALGFLVFTLIYFPCVAVIAAIKNETGSWKWAMFTMVYTTSLAWFLAMLIHQIGRFFV